MRKQNPWKGLILGAVGGLAGTWAMGYYLELASGWSGSGDRERQGGESPSRAPEQGILQEVRNMWNEQLADISLLGKNYRDGETSTQAVGRLGYRMLTGNEPECDETLKVLSELTHWGFGEGMGALYGLTRGTDGGFDLRSGMIFEAGVWLFASELAIPTLGLSPGPSQQPVSSHLNYLGAHLVYGATMAATARLLEELL